MRMQGAILTLAVIGAKGHWPSKCAVVYSSHAWLYGNNEDSSLLPSSRDTVAILMQIRGPAANQGAAGGGDDYPRLVDRSIRSGHAGIHESRAL